MIVIMKIEDKIAYRVNFVTDVSMGSGEKWIILLTINRWRYIASNGKTLSIWTRKTKLLCKIKILLKWTFIFLFNYLN